jgi:Xaa-Pro dipeptidase
MIPGLDRVVPGCEAVFDAAEFDRRQALVRGDLATRGIDVLMVTGPENIFWLTGQQTPGYYTFQALLLPAEGEAVFVVRALEALNLIAKSHLRQIEPYADDADPVRVLVETVQARGWGGKRIAIDERAWFLPIAVYKALLAALGEVGDGSRLVEAHRAVKSPGEIAKIEIAAGYAQAGIAAGLDAVRAGASENDVVGAMMSAVIATGSEYLGMEPLVASGPRSGVPHGTWRRRRLEPGDPVILEMAGCHDRYHATLWRSAWLGRPPDLARRMMDCCLEALDASLEALRPGATCAVVHGACQAVVDRHGFTENFRKRSGYSIGISFAPDWGEGNVLSLYHGVDVPIECGMVFHMPPALRDYGVFTVGVSETVVVTETGNRVLSTLDRDLRIV